jgi:hypothetical protein
MTRLKVWDPSKSACGPPNLPLTSTASQPHLDTIVSTQLFSGQLASGQGMSIFVAHAFGPHLERPLSLSDFPKSIKPLTSPTSTSTTEPTKSKILSVYKSLPQNLNHVRHTRSRTVNHPSTDCNPARRVCAPIRHVNATINLL